MMNFFDKEKVHAKLIEDWRKLNFVGASWVLFNQGTVVMPRYPADDLEEQVIDIMKEHGPLLIGSPAADFTIRRCPEPPGLLVYYDWPDIVSFVPDCFRSQVDDHPLRDFFDAMSARACRHVDSQELSVVHVEKGEE